MNYKFLKYHHPKQNQHCSVKKVDQQQPKMKGFSDKCHLGNDKLLDYTCFVQIISSLTPKPAHVALHHNPLTVRER